MQEDQIYALQDYINQYQRLLCQYRSENASLRRQLSENYTTGEPQSAEPQPASVPRSASPPLRSAPQFKAPEPPGVKQQQFPPTPTTPEITPPDVPPLKSTTDDTSDQSPARVAANEQPGGPDPKVLQASYDTTAPRRQLRAEDSPTNALPASQSGAINELMISGEVVAASSGGPRLMVDVVPFDSSGLVQPFEGSASIMLLEINEDGKQHNLGRWDFSPDEVRAAVNTATGKPTMRYFIELPPNAQPGGPVQLWVRLVPQNGEKLLTHALVDVTKPGIFSSRLDKLERSNPPADVVAATYAEETSTPAPETTATNIESAWVVAQPGKPANLPPEESDTTGAGGWRASTQLMPAILATSTNAVPNAANSTPAPLARHAATAATKVPAKRPSWSSDRSSDSARRNVTRPSWSETR